MSKRFKVVRISRETGAEETRSDNLNRREASEFAAMMNRGCLGTPYYFGVRDQDAAVKAPRTGLLAFIQEDA